MHASSSQDIGRIGIQQIDSLSLTYFSDFDINNNEVILTQQPTHFVHNREYPVDWITRHMERDGLRVIKTKSFNILHSVESATRQIRVAQTKLDLMPSGALKQGMTTYLEELTERVKVAVASAGGKIPLSYDYVISAESVDFEERNSTSVLASSIFAPFSIFSAPFSTSSAQQEDEPANPEGGDT